uniref:Uncharacterized protein n=1 Tax=Aegilops tauschii subsp. strangulata TaxID=200361 RepID=A0A452Y0Z8_AEGTS
EQSALGSMPVIGSTPCVRGSWNKTGHGTGPHWTTLNCTMPLENSDTQLNQWQEQAHCGIDYSHTGLCRSSCFS